MFTWCLCWNSLEHPAKRFRSNFKKKETSAIKTPVSKLLGEDPAQVERGRALNLDALVSAVLVLHLQQQTDETFQRIQTYLMDIC